METQTVTCLTNEQQKILLSIFQEGRYLYSSRSSYDKDYKSLSKCTLLDLYSEWKSFNTFLAQGGRRWRSTILQFLDIEFTEASYKEVRWLRQVFGIFSRLSTSYCANDAALSDYRTRVRSTRSRVPDWLVPSARELVASWLGPAPRLMDLIPNHGPGAVAECFNHQEKMDFPYMYPQLQIHGGEDLLYQHSIHKELEPRSFTYQKHPITRVVLVPKDFVKPRVISCEPVLMQFLQQGLCKYLMQRLTDFCPYINFSDQSVNANMSRDLSYATLDLSNASDTVSRRIVKQLVPADWWCLLSSLRSHFARMPSGELVPLRAFAPMGSALCFPVESLVFAAIVVSLLQNTPGIRSRTAQLRLVRSSVRIYGDDIIVPVEYGPSVMVFLRECGFEPNERKCCIYGLFRESCGAEWYNGHDVTICRPESLHSHAVITRTPLRGMPMVYHANRLYKMGYLRVAQLFADLCNFPVAVGDREGYALCDLNWPIIGRFRFNKKLQRLEQQTMLPVQVSKSSDTGTGYKALFLGLTSRWSSERVLIPRCKPKIRWVSAAPMSER